VGMIGLDPKTFWDMSPQEIYIVIEGFMEFNGQEQKQPMTRNELKDLMELYPD